MKTLTVAVVVGMAVVALAWWFGPVLFGASEARAGDRTVRATVTEPASCTAAEGRERVNFTLRGEQRSGVLLACGHDKNEQLRVTIPTEAESGTVTVHSAGASTGYSALRVPLGLVLLAMSAAAGGVYAFLVIRGPRVEYAAR